MRTAAAYPISPWDSGWRRWARQPTGGGRGARAGRAAARTRRPAPDRRARAPGRALGRDRPVRPDADAVSADGRGRGRVGAEDGASRHGPHRASSASRAATTARGWARWRPAAGRNSASPMAAWLPPAPGRALRSRAAPRHDVACVVVEPMQGRGGVFEPPEGWLAELRKCDRGDAAGGGRGLQRPRPHRRMWACQAQGLRPICWCAARRWAAGCRCRPAWAVRADGPAWAGRGEVAIDTHTHLGSPVSCAAALAVLDELERRELPQRAAELERACERSAGRARPRAGAGPGPATASPFGAAARTGRDRGAGGARRRCWRSARR